MNGWSGGLLAIILLLLNGGFVAAEFALLAARRSRMEQLAEQGDKRAVAAVGGLRELSLALAGAQLGITMCSLGLGLVAEPLVAGFFEHLLADRTPLPEPVAVGLGFAIGLAIVVFLHMVVGEMAPKSWAIADPERSSLLLARPFLGFVALFRPIIRLLNAGANALVRAFGVEPREELAVAHAPSDLLMVLRESALEGTIADDDHALLSRALELTGLDAESIMVPRREVVSVTATASAEEVLDVARRTGRSRLPVHGGDLDQVLGVLTIKDLVVRPEGSEGTRTAATLARPAMVVPESRPIEDLLLDMRLQRQHIAMVVDEYGSVSGLVSLEDVIEELIGDFDDETDRVSRRLRRSRDGQVVLAADLRPHEIAERTGLTLPEGPWETLAGYIEHRTGAIPEVGTTVTLGGVVLSVTAVDRFRITEVAVRPRPGADLTR